LEIMFLSVCGQEPFWFASYSFFLQMACHRCGTRSQLWLLRDETFCNGFLCLLHVLCEVSDVIVSTNQVQAREMESFWWQCIS
jgi:hypothetical protein